jgi:hypothetical protein
MGEKNHSGVRTEVRGSRRILIVDFRYRDKDRREQRYRRDASVQTRSAAVAEAQRLKRLAVERGTLEAERAPLTFEQFVNGDFTKLVLPRFKPSTREGYEQLLLASSHGLVALLGGKRLDAIGAADARAVEASAIARGARPRYALVCLRTVLRSAGELGALAHAPRLPKLPARSEKLPAAPPASVVEQLLEGARGWLRVAVALAALGGLRCGEIRALEVGDVDLGARRLYVRRAMSAEELADPKGPRRAGCAAGTPSRCRPGGCHRRPGRLRAHRAQQPSATGHREWPRERVDGTAGTAQHRPAVALPPAAPLLRHGAGPWRGAHRDGAAPSRPQGSDADLAVPARDGARPRGCGGRAAGQRLGNGRESKSLASWNLFAFRNMSECPGTGQGRPGTAPDTRNPAQSLGRFAVRVMLSLRRPARAGDARRRR